MFKKSNVIESSRRDFQAILEENALLGLEKQIFISKTIGVLPWEIDVKKGIITFNNEKTYKFQIIGTYAKKSKNWMWIWANHEVEASKESMLYSEKLKSLGIDERIAEFSEPAFKSDPIIIHQIGCIATGIFEDSFYYICDYGEGSALVTVKDEKIDEDMKNDNEKIVEIFNNSIRTFELNARRSMYYYLKKKGFETEANGNKITAIKNKTKILCEFDLFKRAKRIKILDI